LREHGVQGIEIAPTKVWPDWVGATPEAARAYRTKLEHMGFTIPAMQAVLFGRPEARLFDKQGHIALIEHLTAVARLSEVLGAGVVVLGAPRQRDRTGLSMDEALDRAIPIFRHLGNVYYDHGSCLCIEPNPRRYSCNFIVNAVEGAALVRAVASPGFALHLDAAAMHLEAEHLEQVWTVAGPLVRHYHISEPDLADFVAPQVPHDSNFECLARYCYANWCSVEMREPAKPLAEVGPWHLLDVARNAASRFNS
jgi:sugar phosphate isomerase/epimerase